MNLQEREQHFERDIEATEDELKGVTYTAVSLISFVIVLLGSVIAALF